VQRQVRRPHLPILTLPMGVKKEVTVDVKHLIRQLIVEFVARGYSRE
jgi:hypothetical protein